MIKKFKIFAVAAAMSLAVVAPAMAGCLEDCYTDCATVFSGTGDGTGYFNCRSRCKNTKPESGGCLGTVGTVFGGGN